MAETTQIAIDLKEAATLLLREQKINEGKWFLGLDVNFMAGNVGPSAAEVKPAFVVTVNRLVLVRQAVDAPDTPYTVDASKL